GAKAIEDRLGLVKRRRGLRIDGLPTLAHVDVAHLETPAACRSDRVAPAREALGAMLGERSVDHHASLAERRANVVATVDAFPRAAGDKLIAGLPTVERDDDFAGRALAIELHQLDIANLAEPR